MNQGRVTVVGSANVDMIMKVDRLPVPGETVTGGEFMQVFGGKGANTAVAAARAGGAVSFVACVGDDHYGHRMIENFRADGIDTSAVELLRGSPCGSALIMVDAHGENYIGVAPGTNFDLTPERVRECEAAIAGAEVVLLQMEIPIDTNREVIRLAHANGARVILNYAPAQNTGLELSSELTGLIVNEVEAEALSGCRAGTADEAEVAARELLSRGLAFVIVTLGSQGALAVTRDGADRIPAFPVTPVDTTAAGDTFCGALGVALAEGRKLSDAIRFANAAGALAVTAMGAQPSIPRRDRIEKLLGGSAHR